LKEPTQDRGRGERPAGVTMKLAKSLLKV